jgi:hypothetical protein
VFARVPALRSFALGEPVWAPSAAEEPRVDAAAGKLTCVAPAYDGPAEVTGAIWSRLGDSGDSVIVRSASGLTLGDPHPGVRYTCSVRAHNAGGASRTAPSEPVIAITGK